MHIKHASSKRVHSTSFRYLQSLFLLQPVYRLGLKLIIFIIENNLIWIKASQQDSGVTPVSEVQVRERHKAAHAHQARVVETSAFHQLQVPAITVFVTTGVSLVCAQHTFLLHAAVQHDLTHTDEKTSLLES